MRGARLDTEIGAISTESFERSREVIVAASLDRIFRAEVTAEDAEVTARYVDTHPGLVFNKLSKERGGGLGRAEVRHHDTGVLLSKGPAVRVPIVVGRMNMANVRPPHFPGGKALAHLPRSNVQLSMGRVRAPQCPLAEALAVVLGRGHRCTDSNPLDYSAHEAQLFRAEDIETVGELLRLK
jgi:hypothetical protein